MATLQQIIEKGKADLRKRDPVGAALSERLASLPKPVAIPAPTFTYGGVLAPSAAAPKDEYFDERASLYAQLEARGLIHHQSHDFGDVISDGLGKFVEYGTQAVVIAGIAYGGYAAVAGPGASSAAAGGVATPASTSTPTSIGSAGIGSGSHAVVASSGGGFFSSAQSLLSGAALAVGNSFLVQKARELLGLTPKAPSAVNDFGGNLIPASYSGSSGGGGGSDFAGDEIPQNYLWLYALGAIILTFVIYKIIRR